MARFRHRVAIVAAGICTSVAGIGIAVASTIVGGPREQTLTGLGVLGGGCLVALWGIGVFDDCLPRQLRMQGLTRENDSARSQIAPAPFAQTI
jgi:hypothetical protein